MEEKMEETKKIDVQEAETKPKEVKVEVKPVEKKPHFTLEVQDSKMGTSSKIGGK